MKANVGSLDKVIRLLVAITLIILFYAGVLKGILGISGLILALLLTLTSLLSYCPLYSLFNISTKSNTKK